MTAIQFRTLGTLDLRAVDGRELHALLAQPKRIALLAYLCVATPRGFHRRDTLLGLLWPEADQVHARTSLRNAVHFLRRSLGDNAILSRGDEEVGANFEQVFCDAVTFEEHVRARRIDEALTLYCGDFLPGFFLDEVPAFEHWLSEERASLRNAAASAARVSAEKQETERNLTGAVSWARRALELSDTDERALRRLVELLNRVGDRAGALAAYDEFARRLDVDYDAVPSAETRALIERVRHRPVAAGDGRLPVEPEVIAKSTDSPGSSPVHSAGWPSTNGETQGIRSQVLPQAIERTSGYVVEREIGRGATSTVYLARDQKHGRNIALKILRPEIAVMVGTERFLAEISVAARLHHPHILPLFDSGEIDGIPYYAMPYVAGDTLRGHLRRDGPLPLEEAVSIACEIADALGYAHSQGIVHRDIKPENILLENGHALVADFGIARALSEAGGERLTQTGIAVGTPAYMSPEQADGTRKIDERTDIYALGSVLYEMLTGDPPFTGSSAQAILSRKAAEPAPRLRTVRDTIPESVEKTVLRAIARTPADRFSSTKQFVDALKSLSTDQSHVWFSPRRFVFPRVMVGVLAIVFALAAVVTGLVWRASLPPPIPVRHKLTASGNAMMASLAPDGRYLAYVGQVGDSMGVFIRDLEEHSQSRIAVFGAPIYTLEWSPSGDNLLVGTLRYAYELSRTGKQAPRIVTELRSEVHAYYLPDGSRITAYAPETNRIRILGLRREETTTLMVGGNPNWLLEGSWSPNGQVFAVSTQTDDPLRWQIRAVSRSGQTRMIVDDSVPLRSPRWSKDGSAVYYARGRTGLWRIPVSGAAGERHGAPEQLYDDMQLYSQDFGAVHFALSADGKQILYPRGARYSNLWRVEPGDSASAPRTTSLTTGSSLISLPAVSPDGQWIAFAHDDGSGAPTDLFKLPIDGGTPAEITLSARVKNESQVAWSPDGKQLAFETIRGGHPIIGIANVADGQIRLFDQTRMSTVTSLMSWAPASRIAYERMESHNVALLDPNSGDEQQLMHDLPRAWLHAPQYSPDGTQLAVFMGIGPEKSGLWVHGLRNSSRERLMAGPVYPRGWSKDSRYVYAQPLRGQTLFRVRRDRTGAPERFITLPFRESQCTLAGVRHTTAFICAAFDFDSDIWSIADFDARHN